jgi:hypothetical protein
MAHRKTGVEGEFILYWSWGELARRMRAMVRDIATWDIATWDIATWYFMESEV